MLKSSGKRNILCSRVRIARNLGQQRLQLLDAVYLDHAGTTLYSKSLMERFTADMMGNLFGNPHSASESSQLSTNRIEDTRLQALRFFNADPDEFDLIFVANATAGIKLVMEALRECDGGFKYGYHRDAHTSLIGVRENAASSRCLVDLDVENWLSGKESLVDEEAGSKINLFAYPAQSNMDGRRLPLSWASRVPKGNNSTPKTYTLLDASAFVSTAQLDLSEANAAPDFIVLSFYKIFGFPDLGALIVRKESRTILQERKYFGGGTVDMVLCVKEQWHVPKSQALHESLEDGTLPFHNILALDAAIATHRQLYGTMDQISKHTAFLAQKLYDGMAALQHFNSEPVCVMHSPSFHRQGPIIAFNLKNSHGAWVSNTEFEKLAAVRKFHVRSGGLCNPGGVAACLKLEPWEMRQNLSSGFKCGTEADIYGGKITGVIRVSVGAMSIKSDVEAFISFVKEFYCETVPTPPISPVPVTQNLGHLVVEGLTVYPIKSCGGLEIPPDTDWEVRPEGLAWDREWCLIHRGTGQALSQKRHPRMALIRPMIDFERGFLHVQYHGTLPPGLPKEISILLSENPTFYSAAESNKPLSSRVCGEAVVTRMYGKKEINKFFSEILGVACVLARFPAGGSGFSTRHSKAHMQKHQKPKSDFVPDVPGSFPAPPTPPDSDSEVQKQPILLSNESPILAINKASLDALNDEIIRHGAKPASASVFRANVVLGTANGERQNPYSEDHWTSLRIGRQTFKMLGSCRRCHMICVDQDTAEKNDEPFVTLAKTRRFESKIFFGSHMCHMPSKELTREGQYPTVRVGDVVTVEG
jgi:molybdenum cofactor sulfurtransferase